MNTPAHAIVNLLVLSPRRRPDSLLPVAAGALLSDLPMILFYFHHKVVLGTPESIIWTEAYYPPLWQTLFDAFNALPLLVPAAVVAFAFRARAAGWMLASMAVHALCDLPLHNDDAHRHFFPFSDWRFESPISYWDPGHFGIYFALVEILLVLLGSVFLVRRHPGRLARGIVGAVGLSYLVYLAYVLVVWV